MMQLVLGLLAFAAASPMRTCHQTCAELLNHDARCERACAAKDQRMSAAHYCPEFDGCMKSCDSRGDRQSSAWGDCRDVCVAISIRVDCGDGEAPPGGSGGTNEGGPKAIDGGGATVPTIPAPPPAASIPGESQNALLHAFDGKGQMANQKVKGALQPSSGLEGIVESAIQSGRHEGGGAELTLFERVHRKYFAIETALRPR